MNTPSSQPIRPYLQHEGDAAETHQNYCTIRSVETEDNSICVLHIGTDITVVASGSAPDPEAIRTLAIGARKTAADYFKHWPPTPGELENAIMNVEDALAPVRLRVTGDSRLFSTDESVREIAHHAGIAGQAVMNLTADAIERTFERLCTIAQGKSASADALPESVEFAATLLILREFMHHMGLPSITILP